MNIPLLRPSRRSREYNLYSNEKKSKIIIGWLFTDHKHHRGLDSEVLGLDSGVSRGYQSMGVLHYLGLKKEFKGIFLGKNLSDAMEILANDRQDFAKVISLIELSIENPMPSKSD